MEKNYNVIIFFSDTVILRKPGVVIFGEIIKKVTMFIKTIIQDSRKVKRIKLLSKSSL